MSERLCRVLDCDLPIQLAPMGSVSATARLPLAVSAAGAHAMYPGLSLPPAALAPVLEALVAAKAAFGVNFIVPFMNVDSLELAVEQAPYVDFFLADPDRRLVQRVHAGGARCGWQVESVEEARAAEAAGCDVVIAKAWESGGRKRIEGPTLLALLDGVLDAVTIPVVAAGGIATARGVAAALSAGADGVRVGTRFIAAAESDAHPEWVNAVLAARAEEAVVSTLFNVGLPEPAASRAARLDRSRRGTRRRASRRRPSRRRRDPGAPLRSTAAHAGLDGRDRGHAVLRGSVGRRGSRGPARRGDRRRARDRGAAT